MPYLGRSPGSGVRSRFIYAATAGQTSFSGNDSNSVSLAYEDTLYMDVYQNGVLLKPVTDYAATTGTSVVLTTGATTDDVVEMIVYDTFAVADTVSASNGGTFAGDVAFTANANFGDNNKAQFGAGSDLQIYHDGSNSYIDDAGTGTLNLRANAALNIKKYTGEIMFDAVADGAVTLRHDNSIKFATTSTGVDITGAFTATDGCTITTADNSAQLTLTSTDADGSAGPILVMNRDSGSPAVGDVLGQILYKFDNESAESTEAIRINAILSDSTDGSEDARLQIEQMFGGSMFSFLTMSKDGIIFNENSQDIDFRVESDGNANMINVDAGNNLVGIGMVPDTTALTVSGQIGTTNGTEGAPTHSFYSDVNTGMFRPSGDHLGFSTGGTERLRIDNGGTLLVGTTTTAVNSSSSVAGFSVQSSGILAVARSGGDVASFNRQTNDGTVIQIHQAGTVEGTISVSGTTVSYNGGHISRFSQATDGNRIDGLVKGTVMTNLDQMAEWTKDGVTEDNEQLNCMAVSSVEGDANVAGVFVNFDDDDKDHTADMNIAMTGDMVIRIAQGTTVARGDLLMSAGDGTAKPQGDDIVRSKTIAKVTSITVSHTYDDGTYLVPCVLMAC